MTSTILSRTDIDFLLYDWIDVESLTANPRFADHSRETFDAVLDLAQALAERHFRPHNRTSDLHEPTFDGQTVHLIPEIGEALAAFAESGLSAGTMDEDLGGIQLPHIVHRAAFAWLQAANLATCGYPMLTMANANLLLTYGSAEQVATFVRPMLDGRFFGTMCLSEPDAGSSLADVTTKAVPDGKTSPDGQRRYRLTGRKMWISGGEHELGDNIVHLVLARVAGAGSAASGPNANCSPPGVKGLSLFIVPRSLVADDGAVGERNDVALVGLNHKMGYRGTTNTLLNFGDGAHRPDGSAGAIGYLVGEENRGLEYMFHMMNEARIGVGTGAAALAYTGYLESLDYARNRPQGRPLGRKDPTSAQVPITEHADVRRMLLASKAYAEGSMALVLYAAKLLDESYYGSDTQECATAARLLDVLTPIVKSWPSQWGPVANDLAIQIHGGAGYTRDHNVEQFYRDNRLNPIHEGTHGIQGLDLLGRKVIQDGGAGLGLLAETIRATINRTPAPYADWAAALSDRLDDLVEVTGVLWRDADPVIALANSSLYLEAAGHIVVAWIWLEQTLAADGQQGSFYDGKRAAARYFFTYELPKVDAQIDLLATRDSQLLDLDPTVL